MEVSHFDQYRAKVKPAIISKLEELSILGYGKVTEEEVWNYLIVKKWKNKNEELRLFEMIQSILTLKVGEFMNFKAVEVLKSSDSLLDNEEDLLALLK